MTFHLPVERQRARSSDRVDSIITSLGCNDEEFYEFLQSSRFEQFSGEQQNFEFTAALLKKTYEHDDIDTCGTKII